MTDVKRLPEARGGGGVRSGGGGGGGGQKKEKHIHKVCAAPCVDEGVDKVWAWRG